jgi:heptosyltransferase-2
MAEQVLVIGPSWVGDMILAQSLFKLLKQERPGVQIDVAAPAWTLPLLERMPEVRAGIALPFRHGKFDLMARIRIGRELRSKRYDQAILLTNSFKSAILPYAASIPRRTGFAGEMRYGLLNDIRPLDKTLLPKTVDRFAALGLPANQRISANLPLPLLNASREQALAALAKLGRPAPQTPVLALCPGAEYGPAKRWPAEYFAEVAEWALTEGWEVWLFGSSKDNQVTQQIDRLTGNRCLDLGGKTSLA